MAQALVSNIFISKYFLNILNSVFYASISYTSECLIITERLAII